MRLAAILSSSLILLAIFSAFGYAHSKRFLSGGFVEEIWIIEDSTRTQLYLPYAISQPELITGGGDTLSADSEYKWIDSLKAIKIDENYTITYPDTLKILYRSLQVSESWEFFYYELDTAQTSIDSLTEYKPEPIKTGKAIDPFKNWEGLRRKGTITRGLSFGGSEGAVTSGLHLELSGKPASDVVVDAVLDDRDLPASSNQGGSATLSELDKILLKISSPYLDAELGDWDLNWQNGRYSRITKRLKGGHLTGRYGVMTAEAAAAGSDNTFHSIMINADAGIQGPYDLTDKNGNRGVTVIVGSEKVYLDGDLLSRGRTNQYTIDYRNGTIAFTPAVIILDNSRIEVEYEYIDGNYARHFYAGKLAANRIVDGKLTVESNFIAEGRNRDRPLSFDWKSEWKNKVKDAGDNPLAATVSGIDTVGRGEGDYIWESIDGRRILKFSQPDSAGKPTGFLSVTFSVDSAGDYSRHYDSDLQAYYFEWEGVNQGNWSPVIYLPLPENLNHYSILFDYDDKFYRIESEAAFSDFDKNTLSSIGDDNNSGFAYNAAAYFGDSKNSTVFGLLKFDARDGRYASLQRSQEPDYLHRWNITDDLEGERREYEAEISLRPYSGLLFQSGAGWLDRGEDGNNYRYELKSEWAYSQIRTFLYYSLARRTGKQDSSSNDRETLTGQISRSRGAIKPGYVFDQETVDAGKSGNRWRNHNLYLDLGKNRTNNLRIAFRYSNEDLKTVNGYINSTDMRTVQTDWSLRNADFGGAGLSLQRSYLTYGDPFLANSVSNSVDLRFYYLPVNSPLRFDMDYALNTGNRRIELPVAEYAGENKGNYRREGSRYVPDPNGDFILTGAETDTVGLSTNVKLSSKLYWRRKKQNVGESGVLNALTSSTTRLDVFLSTEAGDPLEAVFLYPTAFKTGDLINSNLHFNQDFNFLERNSTGNGKLSVRYIEDRSRFSAGGELVQDFTSVLRLRNRIDKLINTRIEPVYGYSKRTGLISGKSRSKVESWGSEQELILRNAEMKFEPGIEFEYEERNDRLDGYKAIIRSWIPSLNWSIMQDGLLRIETEYARLTSSSPSPNYDLDKGWQKGDNYVVTANFDYLIRSYLTVRAFYRGRWIGKRVPRHEGFLELTATL